PRKKKAKKALKQPARRGESIFRRPRRPSSVPINRLGHAMTASRRFYGSATDLDRNPELRTAQRPGSTDDWRTPQRTAFPHAGWSQQRRGEVRAQECRDRRGRSLERDRQGLRVREGQLRRARAGGH